MEENQVIWLASYPKTGSNWVRRIIRGLVDPASEPSIAVPSVRRQLPKGAPVYDIYGKSVNFYKTHSHPIHVWHLARPAAVILVDRHPLDVILSYLNYSYHRRFKDAFISNIPKTVDELILSGEIDFYIKNFLSNDCIPEYRKLSGSFEKYTSNWRRFSSGTPILRLRYEKMIENDVACVRKISRFLDISGADVHGIASIIRQQTQQDGRFHWKKSAYNFIDMLTEGTVRQFEESAVRLLSQLQYDPVHQRS